MLPLLLLGLCALSGDDHAAAIHALCDGVRDQDADTLDNHHRRHQLGGEREEVPTPSLIAALAELGAQLGGSGEARDLLTVWCSSQRTRSAVATDNGGEDAEPTAAAVATAAPARSCGAANAHTGCSADATAPVLSASPMPSVPTQSIKEELDGVVVLLRHNSKTVSLRRRIRLVCSSSSSSSRDNQALRATARVGLQ